MLVGAVQLRMLASWGGGKVEFFLGILLLNLNLLQLLVFQAEHSAKRGWRFFYSAYPQLAETG